MAEIEGEIVLTPLVANLMGWNARNTSWALGQCIAGLEREVAELKAQLRESREREARSFSRMLWLMGDQLVEGGGGYEPH